MKVNYVNFIANGKLGKEFLLPEATTFMYHNINPSSESKLSEISHVIIDTKMLSKITAVMISQGRINL